MIFAHKLKTLAVAAMALAAAAISAQAEPLKITIGWSQTPGHVAPLLFQNKSILKHYGKTYTVDAVRFRGSTAQLTALASGRLDIAALSATALDLAVTNAGIDARVVGDVIQDRAPYWSSGFWVLKSSGINKIEDLKGKRIAHQFHRLGDRHVDARHAAQARAQQRRLQHHRGVVRQHARHADVGQGRHGADPAAVRLPARQEQGEGDVHQPRRHRAAADRLPGRHARASSTRTGRRWSTSSRTISGRCTGSSIRPTTSRRCRS